MCRYRDKNQKASKDVIYCMNSIHQEYIKELENTTYIYNVELSCHYKCESK